VSHAMSESKQAYPRQNASKKRLTLTFAWILIFLIFTKYADASPEPDPIAAVPAQDRVLLTRHYRGECFFPFHTSRAHGHNCAH
jgi:hypothetical protein